MRLKRILSVILCTIFIAGHAQAADTYYRRESSRVLTKGVIHRTIELFTQRGWITAEVIEIDYSTPGLNLEALTDKRGVSYRDNVLSLAKQYDNILAAINADFFQAASGKADRAAPIGVVVKDGEILSTPAEGQEMAAVYETALRNVEMGNWGHYIEVVAPNGEAQPVAHINKFYDAGGLVIYTRDWAETSPGSWLTKYEILVVDGVVADIREGGEGFVIPENGYVLASTAWEYDFLRDQFQIGDKVVLNCYTEPDASGIKMALGGGTLLVKDGEVAPVTHNVSGINPRSAMGVDKSGTRVFFVAVDGRQQKSTGMTLPELSQFMIELGCDYAINFDGGGSTVMAARAMGEDLAVVNSPSEPSLRRVTNAVGLKYDFPESNAFAAIELSGEDRVFVGGSVALTVRAYNEYHAPVEFDVNNLQWSVGGAGGEVKGGIFYPKSKGTAEITANYGGISAKKSILVLDEPKAVLFTPSDVPFVKGAAADITAYLVDGNGFSAPIDISELSFAQSNVARIEGNKIIVENPGVLTAEFGGAKGHFGIGTGGLIGSTVADSFEKSKAAFSSYPAYVGGALTFTDEESKGGNAAKLEFDFTSDLEDTKAAYLNYGTEGIPIPKGAKKIGVWAYVTESAPYRLRAEFRDKGGAVHRADLAAELDWQGWRFVEAEIPAGAAEGALWRIYVVQTNNIPGRGAVYFDDLTFAGDPAAPQMPKADMPDNLKTDGISGGLRIGVFGTGVGQGRLIDKLFANKAVYELNKKADVAIFLGPADEGALSVAKIPVFSGGGYAINRYGDFVIINVNNSGGGIRAADPAQWPRLISDLENADAKNIFIALEAPFDTGFSDKAEAGLFEEILEKAAARGKNIFVLSPGEENKTYLKNGVRYITAAGTNAIGNDLGAAAENCRYTIFGVEGEKAAYANVRVIE